MERSGWQMEATGVTVVFGMLSTMLSRSCLCKYLRSPVVLCAIMLIAVAALTGCASDAVQSLRVMSYNIHHGEGTDGEFDLQRIADVINARRPDLVALQEVGPRLVSLPRTTSRR